MINMSRDDIPCVAARVDHGMALVLDNDTTSALANLLSNLVHVAMLTPPNYMDNLIQLRKEAFGY